MICVSVEKIGEGALARRVRISARSIERGALKLARSGKPGLCRGRLVFPIDPEAFFVPEDSGKREAAVEMERAGSHCTKETISSPESDEAAPAGVRYSRSGEVTRCSR